MDILTCTDKFLKKIQKLGVKDDEVFAPLLQEMMKQIDTNEPNILKIRKAIEKVKGTKGYQSRFEDALNFVSNNWGTTEVSSKGIGKKYEEMFLKQQSLKKQEENLVKFEKIKIVENVSKLGKDSRFKEAFSELNLNKCREWLRYLRDTKSTGFSKTLAKNSEAWKAAYKRAGELINPLLSGRKIYDDSRSVQEDLIGASQSEAKETSIRIVLEHYKLTDISSPTHWFAKGMILAMNTDITIRCDGSAALAFYVLAMDKEFNASVALVQQGENPRESGHWFLVAGAKEDLVTEKINVFGEKKQLGWLFTVDLWGASFKGVESTLLYPGGCMVGEWKHKVLWSV
jgi:hypothetical protein